MEFTTEDGTGVEDANAYIDAEYFQNYHTLRGNAYPEEVEEIEVAIVRATDYIETVFSASFRGRPSTSTQGLSFPRSGLRDRHGCVVIGLPEDVKRACAEYALLATKGALMPDPSANSNGQVTKTRVKVGPIEEENTYAATTSSSASKSLNSYPQADRLLMKYVNSGGSVIR